MNKPEITAAFSPLERIYKVAEVYWGRRNESFAKQHRNHPENHPDKILERVIADYAMVGKVPLATIIDNAKARVKKLKEEESQ